MMSDVRREGLLTWAMALLFAAPLIASRYFPGLDLPWHAAVCAVLHAGDEAVRQRFLGQFTVDHELTSYLTMYVSVDALTNLVGDVAVAMQIVIAAYVVCFVVAARRLVRAFGGDGVIAVLAAPAAYSLTLGFGFLSYAMAFPMTFWLWALGREALAERPSLHGVAARLVGALALAALIAVTHPFAAAVAVVGAVILVATHARRGARRRSLLFGAAVLLGMVPAALAVLVAGGDAAAPAMAPIAGGGLFDQLGALPYTPPQESLAAAPVWLFGFVAPGWRFALVLAGLAAAIGARFLAQGEAAAASATGAGPGAAAASGAGAPGAWVARGVLAGRSRTTAPPPVAAAGAPAAAAGAASAPALTPAPAGEPDSTAARRAPLYLLAALVALYLLTPFTFEWPRRWFAAQPRLLPAIWVVALVALRWRPVTGRAALRVAAAPVAVAVAAWLLLVATALGPFTAEAWDFRAIVRAAAPEARTLALIETAPVGDRAPAEPWRHAGAWLMAERGGFVSNLPFTDPGAGNAGSLIPVHRAASAPPPPPAPGPAQPRTFDWARHAAGWDQFLIRDRDPSQRWDYFRGHDGEVRLVLQAGHWRLFARR